LGFPPCCPRRLRSSPPGWTLSTMPTLEGHWRELESHRIGPNWCPPGSLTTTATGHDQHLAEGTSLAEPDAILSVCGGPLTITHHPPEKGEREKERRPSLMGSRKRRNAQARRNGSGSKPCLTCRELFPSRPVCYLMHPFHVLRAS
jgi:hypothetical protein